MLALLKRTDGFVLAFLKSTDSFVLALLKTTDRSVLALLRLPSIFYCQNSTVGEFWYSMAIMQEKQHNFQFEKECLLWCNIQFNFFFKQCRILDIGLDMIIYPTFYHGLPAEVCWKWSKSQPWLALLSLTVQQF